MPQASYPFAASSIVTEDQWRATFGTALGEGVVQGVLNSLEVYADGVSGLVSKVKTGRGRVQGQFYENTSTEVVLAHASNSSGNPRIDRVVLRNTFGTSVVLAVLQGTPAGSPVAPALTQNTAIWEISLAQIAVANSATNITLANVTGEREFLANRLRTVPRVRAIANGTQSVTNITTTSVAFAGTDVYDTDTMHDPVTNNTRITFNTAGLYLLIGAVQFNDPVTDSSIFIRTIRAAATTNDIVQLLGDNESLFTTTLYQALVGDYAELRVFHTTGAANVIDFGVFMAIWMDR
jgi:hypothetical protein